MKQTWKDLAVTLISLICVCISLPSTAVAGNRVTANLRIIHAATDTTYMDPGLRDLGHELQSVFKYTAYRLLNRKALTLAYNTVGRVNLPGGRRLEISPTGFANGRIKFKINIFKQNRAVFGTEILLRNGSSITIGGPGYENGYLLFNISGTAQ